MCRWHWPRVWESVSRRLGSVTQVASQQVRETMPLLFIPTPRTPTLLARGLGQQPPASAPEYFQVHVSKIPQSHVTPLLQPSGDAQPARSACPPSSGLCLAQLPFPSWAASHILGTAMAVFTGGPPDSPALVTSVNQGATLEADPHRGALPQGRNPIPQGCASSRAEVAQSRCSERSVKD